MPEQSSGYYLKYLRPLDDKDIVPCKLYDEAEFAKEVAREADAWLDDEEDEERDAAVTIEDLREERLLQAAAGVEDLLAPTEDAMYYEEEVTVNGDTVPGEDSSDTCPAGHLLQKFAIQAHKHGAICNRCAKTFSLGSTLHGCRHCNYDLCDACVTTAEDSMAEPKAMPQKAPPHTAAVGSRAPGPAPPKLPPPAKLLNAAAQPSTPPQAEEEKEEEEKHNSYSSSAGSDASIGQSTPEARSSSVEDSFAPPSNFQDLERWVKKRLCGRFMSNPEAAETKKKQWHEISDTGPSECKCQSWTEGEEKPRFTKIRFDSGKILWGKGDVRLDHHSLMGKRIIWVYATRNATWEWVRGWNGW